MHSLSYYDERHADTYVVSLDEDGQFLGALRYVEGIGRDPISYTHLTDIPQPHRSAIEEEIESYDRSPERSDNKN